MSVKVISMSKITMNWTVRIPEIITELLKSDIIKSDTKEAKESTILWIKWILDQGRLLITTREKNGHDLVSYDVIRNYNKVFVMTIPPIIREILELYIGTYILWIVDEKTNIIVKNAILPENCITKEPSVLMNITYVSPLYTRIPKNIREYLKVDPGDTVAFFYDNDITIEKYDEIKSSKSSKLIGITKMYNTEIYFNKQMRSLLNIEDLILWILDSNGNIILKNAILPDICSEK